MIIPSSPWARVKERCQLPAPLTVTSLKQLTPGEFGILVRDYLLPSAPDGPDHRAWSDLWALLRRDDALAHRTFDALEGMLDSTNDALASGSLDDRATARARKFAGALERAWSRIEITRDEPLAWAGRDAAAFNTAGRRVIDQLVAAIAEHRRSGLADGSVRESDRALWTVLATIRLDPDPAAAAAAARAEPTA